MILVLRYFVGLGAWSLGTFVFNKCSEIIIFIIIFIVKYIIRA